VPLFLPVAEYIYLLYLMTDFIVCK